MKHLMVRAVSEEYGQDLIEYALLASLISVIAIEAIVTLGGGVKSLWNLVVAKMPDPS